MSFQTHSKLTFLSSLKSKPLKHRVGDKELDFYPMSGKCLYVLRDIGPRIGKLIGVLTSDDKNDGDYKQQETFAPSSVGEGMVSQSNVETRGVSTATLKFRMDAKNDAIMELIECLTSEEMKNHIYTLIKSCLRLGGDEGLPSCDEFFEEVPVDLLYDTIMGCVAANKRILGPFSESLPKLMSGAMDNAAKKMETGNAEETGKSSKTSTSSRAKKVSKSKT